MKIYLSTVRLLLALVLCLYLDLPAQEKPTDRINEGSAEKTADLSNDITAEEKRQVIEKLSRLLNENYIFPETAEKIEKHLMARLQYGSFDDIKDKKSFAERLTKEVQLVSKDKHMRVFSKSRKSGKQENKLNTIASLYKMKKEYEEQNFGFTRIEKLKGNIGLLEITGFPPLRLAKQHASLAMKLLAGSDALIIDLRRNGGGEPDLIQYISSYLFEKPTHINSIYSRKNNRTEDFITFEEVDGEKFPDVPLFVLTSSYTFSAGEEFAYNIQAQKRGVIIGETTGGGAHPGDLFPVTDDIAVFIPTEHAINPVTKTNWEGTGVIPEIKAGSEQAFDIALEKAAAAAKEYRSKKEARTTQIMDSITSGIEKAGRLIRDKKTKEAEVLLESSLRDGIKNNVFGEDGVNLLGYEYLAKEDFSLAILIFRINTRLFPQSPNVFDSLGEAYMKSGDNKNAAINYRKSLMMNPKNLNASEALKKLGAGKTEG